MGGDGEFQKSATEKEIYNSSSVHCVAEKVIATEKNLNNICRSANFSVAKLHKIYNEKCAPNDRVSLLRNISIHHFNISFSYPASNVCSKWNS